MGKLKLQSLIRTIFASYLISALLLAALAFLLYRFRLSEAQVGLGVNVVYILSCLVGGLLAGKAMKQQRFLWGLATGCAYYFILLAVSFAVGKELGGDLRELAMVFLMCAGSGTLGGMVS